MRIIDTEKYIYWYNLAHKVVQNEELVPNREPWVSTEEWLMFAPDYILSMEEAKTASIPNIFFDLSNGLTERRGKFGLTFNNLPAVEKLRNILSNYCKDEKELLTAALLSLDTVWSIKVQRKIHYKNHQEEPTYIQEYTSQTNEINERVINDIFEVSDRIREEGKQNRTKEKLKQGKSRIAYTEVPSINLMECEFELTEENFRNRVKEIFPIWAICLKIKSDREIKRIELKQREVKVEIQRIKDQLQKQRENPTSIPATPEQIAQKEKRLKELEDKLKKIARF